MKPVAVRMKKGIDSHSYSLVYGELFHQLLLQAYSQLAHCKQVSKHLSVVERRFRRIDVGRKWEAHLSWQAQDLSATDASTT